MSKSSRNRSLQPEEVEVRIDAISPKSITLVVYITARSAMNLLDELYGPENWDKYTSTEKKSADTPFYSTCRIHVHDGETDFVREDVGEDASSPKAAASDALKRTAMNIVPSLRALYTLPALRVNASALDVELSSNPKKEEMKEAVKFRKFKVNAIGFGTSAVGLFVKALQIADAETGDIVLEYTSNTREYRTELSEIQSSKLTELRQKMAEARMSEQQMLDYYGISNLTELIETEKRYKDALINLESRRKKIEAKAKAKPKAEGASINDKLKGERRSTKKGA